MIEIFTAVNSLFTGAPTPAFNTAVGGRMWLLRAPQTTLYPYCVVSLVGSIPDYTFKTESTEATIQFSIFDKASDNSSRGVATLMDAEAKLWQLYDFAQPSVVGYNLTILKRVRNMLLHDPETSVSHSTTHYLLRVSRNYP